VAGHPEGGGDGEGHEQPDLQGRRRHVQQHRPAQAPQRDPLQRLRRRRQRRAARALFLGRQAGVVAFGSPGTGLRFDWNEEMEDRGNQVVITTTRSSASRRPRSRSTAPAATSALSVVDTAAADPNP
jgi:hypothetical protein